MAPSRTLQSRLSPGDIFIDGGNSYYIDDTARGELKQKGHSITV